MVKKMVTNLVESGSKVPTWVLTNFNDPNVELEVNTPDVEELKSSMNELKYGGGDDLREQVLKGKRRLSANWSYFFARQNNMQLISFLSKYLLVLWAYAFVKTTFIIMSVNGDN